MARILVTGSSSGIGFEIAQKLLSLGIDVVGVARRIAPIDHSRYTHIQGDICDAATLDRVVEACKPEINGVILNAGVLRPVARVADANVSEWKQLFDINFFSIVDLTQRLIPALRSSGARVVFVSSGAALNSYTAWGAYGASKAALNSFAKTLAVEEPQITSIALAPGVVDTDMQSDIRDCHSSTMAPQDAAKFSTLHTDGKLNSAKAVAAVYANLALRADISLSGKVLRYGDEVLQIYL